MNGGCRTCDHCQSFFTLRRRWQRFCSAKCRSQYRNAKIAGNYNKIQLDRIENMLTQLLENK